MVERAIVVGDLVINLQMPGIFTVTARDRTFLHIESPDGVRLKVSDAAVRRMEPGATAVPVDPPEE